MARNTWKATERAAAALVGGRRFPASTGGRLDFEAPGFVGQVKNPARMSLAEVEALALEVAEIGRQRGAVGLLVVKRSAGRGTPTPLLVVLTEDAWRALLARQNATPAKSAEVAA